jgi:hypothetical protein
MGGLKSMLDFQVPRFLQSLELAIRARQPRADFNLTLQGSIRAILLRTQLGQVIRKWVVPPKRL